MAVYDSIIQIVMLYDNIATKISPKSQSDWEILSTNLAGSRVYDKYSKRPITYKTSGSSQGN